MFRSVCLCTCLAGTLWPGTASVNASYGCNDFGLGPAYMNYGPSYMNYGLPFYMNYGPEYMNYGLPFYMNYGPEYMNYGLPFFMNYGPEYMNYGLPFYMNYGPDFGGGCSAPGGSARSARVNCNRPKNFTAP